MRREILAITGLCSLFFCTFLETDGGQQADEADRWADAMTTFARQDAANPTEPGGVVFVGSSSIRMWDLRESFPTLAALNRGYGGSQISDSVRHFDLLVAKHRPRIVIIYAGDNDVATGKSAGRVHRDYRAFREKLRAALPETKLLFIAIKPSIARWQLAGTMREANRLIASDCREDKQATFVDVWPVMLGEEGRPREEIFLEDGLHMNKEGYKDWANLIAPLLQEKPRT